MKLFLNQNQKKMNNQKEGFRSKPEILSPKNIFSALFLIYAFIENKFMLCTRHEYFGNDIKIAHIIHGYAVLSAGNHPILYS